MSGLGGRLHVGLSAYDRTAGDLLALARAADVGGFRTLWLGEHLLLPPGYVARHPTHQGEPPPRAIIEASTELLEPMIALGAVAAVTSHLEVATGIYLLGLRHPLLAARSTVTLHDVSNGRLVLGVAAGWLREEFEALGVEFAGRAVQLEESIGVLRAAWAGGPFSYAGRSIVVDGVQITPRPVAIPVFVGGNSERALERAARLADGWLSSGTPSFEESVRMRDRLVALRARHRPEAPLRIVVRVEGHDPDVLERYAGEGFDEVVLWDHAVWKGEDDGRRRAHLASVADELGLEPAPGSPDVDGFSATR